MTIWRALALGALFAVLAGLVASRLWGGDEYTVVAEVQNAGQIVTGNDVKIGAADVGTVGTVELTSSGLVDVELRIDESSAPLPEGTQAAIRANSLAGVANRYVELAPPSGDADDLPDGGTIQLIDTTAPVEFDAFVNTLDPKTRAGLASLISGESRWYAGRVTETRRGTRLIAPALESTTGVLRQLAGDQLAFRGLIHDGSVAARAVASRRTELADLITQAATTTGALGDEAASIEGTLAELPDTLRQANTTFVNLRAALGDLTGLVTAAKPATEQLTPFLLRLEPLLELARTAVPDLSAVVDSAGPDNDLTDLLARLPRLEGLSSDAFPRAIETMDESQHLVDLFRLYTPDMVAAIGNLGAVTSYYDANGHYARGVPLTSALSYDQPTNTLHSKDPADRLDGFELLQGHRCPGGAVQRPPDGSAPLHADGCDPSTDLPGP